ncbi:MAG TPA: AzlD domain-containing protein [Syntrophomonadaceae bacterium]|nr:AzlD domain-containing protein [Syntrophomonadaceae bacterium]
MTNMWILVLGMAVVTYLPRMIPMVGLSRLHLPVGLVRFLRFIPVAALGSLTFPSILYSTGNVSSALAGTLLATGLALARFNIILIVLGGILVVLLWQMLGVHVNMFP